MVAATSAAACSPSGTQPAATPASPTPTLAKTVAFSLTVPPGWSDATSNGSVVSAVRPDGNLLLLLRGPAPAPAMSGVSDVTAVVVVTEPRQPLAASQVNAYLQSVKAAGASDISTPSPVTVSGSAATSVTYVSALGATPTETEDVLVSHAGAMYEIELITSVTAFTEQSALFHQLLTRDWTWVTAD